MTEYTLRVRKEPDQYVASFRQVQVSASHPEVKCVIGPVSRGTGANEVAAMLAAIVASKLPTVPEAS